VNQPLGGRYHLHFHGQILPSHLLAPWFLGWIIFDPEDELIHASKTLVHVYYTVLEDGNFLMKLNNLVVWMVLFYILNAQNFK
jgi:hypothetical protein